VWVRPRGCTGKECGGCEGAVSCGGNWAGEHGAADSESHGTGEC